LRAAADWLLPWVPNNSSNAAPAERNVRVRLTMIKFRRFRGITDG